MTETWYARLGQRLVKAFWVTVGTIWVIFIVTVGFAAWWELTKAS